MSGVLSPEEILEQAVNDHDAECGLRLTHRLLLKRLAAADAKAQPDFARTKHRERRAWLLIQLLNQRLMERRYELVDINEVIDEEIARLERLSETA